MERILPSTTLKISPTWLGRVDRFTRRDPIDGEVVIGIGELRSGLSRLRGLPAFGVGVPGGGDDLVELGGQGLEGRVLEPFQVALAELRLRELRARHALARLGRRYGHGSLPLPRLGPPPRLSSKQGEQRL